MHGGVIFRAVLYVINSDINIQRRFFPFYLADPFGRNLYLLSGKPVARIYHQEMDAPVLIVDNKIFYIANFAIGSMDAVTCNLVNAAQMRVGRLPQIKSPKSRTLRLFLLILLIKPSIT
jgi:hypothetical protein